MDRTVLAEHEATEMNARWKLMRQRDSSVDELVLSIGWHCALFDLSDGSDRVQLEALRDAITTALEG